MNMSSKDRCDGILSRRAVLKGGLCGGLACSLWVSGCSEKRNGERPNVLLISLDTTRADHLSCYGYERRTSPNLDKLAEQSVFYNKAVATSSWTLPSHASMFTGKFTSSHGARYDPQGSLFLSSAVHSASEDYRARSLGRDEVTLAQILKESGYATGGIAGGPWLMRFFGLDKGFDFYDDSNISSINGKSAQLVSESAVKWIEQNKSNEFFLFLNYFDPHVPYMPPKTAAQMFLTSDMKEKKPYMPTVSSERSKALYDAEILYMDHHIGQLLKKLKDHRLYDNTLIIVTADHGELLGEHSKVGHGQNLYQEELWIPLFVKYPGGEVSPSRNDLRAQLTDILPMICRRLGLPVPDGVQGTVPSKSQHPVIAEVYPLAKVSRVGSWRAIFEGDFKFVWNSNGAHKLFNLADDPGEKKNLVDESPDRAESMSAGLNEYIAKLPPPGPPAPAQQLDENTRKALKSLGYVK